MCGRAAAIEAGSGKKRPKAVASATKGKGKHGSDESAAETSEEDDVEVIEVKAPGRDNTPRHMLSQRTLYSHWIYSQYIRADSLRISGRRASTTKAKSYVIKDSDDESAQESEDQESEEEVKKTKKTPAPKKGVSIAGRV
jgi:hypothetical protein